MPTKTPQSKTQKVPKLRFAGFEGGWEEEKLGELAVGGFSNGVFNDPSKVGSGYRLINVKDMYSGDEIDVESLTRVELEQKEFEKNKAIAGDIFFTRSSLVKEGIAYSNILVTMEEDVTFDGHVIRMRPDSKIVFSKFLAKLLKTHDIRSQLVARGKTGTMTTIGQDDLASVNVPFPSLSEQQKIAEFLGGVDEWIENLREQKENLESYKKGMMQKIFSQGIRFKDDKGKEFPEWEEKKLGEIGETYNGLTGKAGDDFGEGDSFITYKQIFDDSEINTSKFALVDVGVKEKQNRARFGDIFFTTSSETPHEVGFSSVLLDKDVSPYLNSFSFGLRPNSLKELDPYFAKLFFRSPLFRKDVVKLAQGSTRYNISKVGFIKIRIMLPSFPEQQKITEFLGSIDKVLESKQQQITQAEQWKKGLMQGLFV